MLKQGNSWQTSFYAWESFPGAKNFVFSLDRLRDRGPQRQPSPATCPTPIYYLTAAYLVQAASVVVPVCTRGHFISPGYIAFLSFPLSFTTSLEQLRKIVPRYASDLTLLEAWAYHGIDQRIRPHVQ